MPYISIESGKLTAEQKKQLIERLTATASEITHIPEQFFTVTIKELPDENFGIGGKCMENQTLIYQFEILLNIL
ncbi:MAG: tautomerase family protein [Muribaculaceae bacterium]|nr:tautomerase family protein [Muribaculaceae bacterium]